MIQHVGQNVGEMRKQTNKNIIIPYIRRNNKVCGSGPDDEQTVADKANACVYALLVMVNFTRAKK